MRQYELMVILDPETEERSVGTTMERYLAVTIASRWVHDRGTTSTMA